LTSQISECELTEWQAYYILEPWGPEQADLHAASIQAMIANASPNRDRRARPISPADLMPRRGPPPPMPEPGVLQDQFRAAFGHMIVRKGDSNAG
jgi:hypothetical protein